MKREVKVLILTGYGINCEEELEAAYRLADADRVIQVHLSDIFSGEISIHDFDIINFPGGFSYGDDLGSGKVLAAKIKYKELPNGKTLLNELKLFIKNKNFILGICNGFQVLVKLGLLPFTSNTQDVTLTENNSGKFEDRWSYLKVNPKTNSPFLKNIDTLYLPVRHQEGKLIIKNQEITDKIVKTSLNSISYSDSNYNITDIYPFNPNGSNLNCAALEDKTGHILGMMPHPEAFLTIYNHPNWIKLKRDNPNISEVGEGLLIFKNIVSFCKSRK